MRSPGAPRMASSSASGTCRRPILRLSASTKTGPRRVQRRQSRQQLRFESLLRRLRLPGQVAQHRALVRGQFLEVQDLPAARGDGFQKAALAAASGAADDAETETLRQQRQLFYDVTAPGLVAALQSLCIPADFAQDVAEGAAALAAAPAIHQRPPAARLVQQVRFDVARDVLRHQRGAELLRLEGRNLFVQGADAGALFVVQHRHADRARQAVLGELARGARIDDGIEIGELCYRRQSPGQNFRHGFQAKFISRAALAAHSRRGRAVSVEPPPSDAGRRPGRHRGPSRRVPAGRAAA
jgi:hypothetical protein